MIRLLIVARTPAARAHLRALVASPRVEVVGEVRSLAGMSPAGHRLDVILIQAEAEAAEPIAGTGIVEAAAGVVVVGGTLADVATVRAAEGWAILPGDPTAGELRSAIDAVAEGLAVMPADLARSSIDDERSERPESSGEDGAVREALTPRELEVLALLADGLSNKEIAARLGISDQTVKFHVSAIYAKLGVRSRTAAVRRGLRRGLVAL